jgi:beta-phosphoglucomutase-like phosphatase (HAD superfamily)
VNRLFSEIEQAGVPMAIGTACEKNAAYQVLDAAFNPSFIRKLQTLCGGDDTPLKKPNPAIYLLVAEQCGVDPQHCVVLEDTHHGMKAALSAGMKCVTSPSEYAMNHDFSDATLQVTDFQVPSPLTLLDLQNLY